MARAIRLKDLPAPARAKLTPKRKERLTKEQKAVKKALREVQEHATRETFYRVLNSMKLARPSHEFVFHPDRKWRFDYAWVEKKVALEVEGGVFSGGRHTRGAGFLADVEKYNAAAVIGWTVLRCTPSTLTSPKVSEMLRRVLK